MTYRVGNLTGLYSARPTAGQSGRIYLPTDGPVNYLDNGTTWVPLIPGAGTPGSEVAPGNTNPFTLVTSGSTGASMAINGGTITLKCTATGGSTQVLQLANVSRTGNTGPQGWFRTRGAQIGFRGIYVRDTSSTKILVFGFDANVSVNTNQQLTVLEYTGQTTLTSSVFSDLPHSSAEPVGLRLRNDGTNYYAEISIDGVDWFTVYQQAVAAWVPSGGNACGVCINPYSNANCEMNVLAWNVQ